MAGKTNYFEGEVLNVLRGATLTGLGGVDVGLFTAAPTDAYTSGVPTGTEVTGGSYARAGYAAGFSAPAGTPRTISNSSAITFPAPTANWGTVTHFGIFAIGTSNLLFWAALTTPRTINSGDGQPVFAIGALVVGED